MERLESQIFQKFFVSKKTAINSLGNAVLLRHIYKGRLLKISANISFLFYKEIYMKYLILYHNESNYENINHQIFLYGFD
jgi:hypothetical protein